MGAEQPATVDAAVWPAVEAPLPTVPTAYVLAADSVEPTVTPIPTAEPTPVYVAPIAQVQAVSEPQYVSDIEAVLVAAGWPDYLLGEAERVVMCESGGNAGVVSSEGARGLFQEMPFWAGVYGYEVDALFDINVNARIAWMIYQRSGWQPWVCQP